LPPLPFENGTISLQGKKQTGKCFVFFLKDFKVECGDHCFFKSNGAQSECPVYYSEAKCSAFPSSHFFPSSPSLPTLTQEIACPVPLTAN